MYDRHLEATGLTITQYSLLGHLKAFDGITMGALAEKLIMDPTTLTRNLRPLERRALIVIQADPRDRRARRLHLTPRGRAAFDEARPAWVQAQRDLTEVMGHEEAQALHVAIDRMLERLAK
jgi:DNA-binding MarR family transcriptional regulator